jgi:hypothetical protein
MKTTRHAAALLLALAAVCCPAARAQDKVTIKPNLKANEGWNMTQQTDMTMNMKITANGQEQPVDQKVKMDLKAVMTPLEVKDGLATKSKIKFGDDAKISLTMAGRSQDVPFPMAGKELTVTKKADGSVEVEPAGVVDPKTQSMLSDMTDAASAFYPDKPVGVGDKWEVPGDKVAKMFQMEKGAKGTIECTLTGLKEQGGKKVAEVALKGNASGKMQGQLDVTLDLAGPMVLDLDSGQVLSQNMKANMTMKGAQAAGGGQNVTINGSGVISVNQTMTPAK